MKKIFIDANVIISVFNREYPLYIYSARILSLAGGKKFELYTSQLCLAITFYFSSKKSGITAAKKKIQSLLEHIKITSIDDSITRAAASDPRINDFEDGMEYYSAVNASCTTIITEDIEDFYFSEIEVLNCSRFLTRYF